MVYLGFGLFPALGACAGMALEGVTQTFLQGLAESGLSATAMALTFTVMAVADLARKRLPPPGLLILAGWGALHAAAALIAAALRWASG